MANLIKDLDSLARILGAYFFKRRYPLSVTFLVTFRCNFKCSYCNVWQNRVQEMTTQEVFKMIDELSGLGLRRLGFNGGEPLLREDIGELIKYSRSQGIVTTLFTNGWLVKERIEQIKDLNVLLISLDGPAKVHDLQRQAGSFDRVIEAIEAARWHDLKVWTNTVISKHNIEYIDFILGLAKKYNFQCTFQPVYFYSHSSEENKINQLMPVPGQYQALIDKLIKLKKQGAPIVHSLKYLEYIKRPDWLSNKRRCWAGKLYFAILPDGKVAPCYPVFADHDWPNGKQFGYRQAINSLTRYRCSGCFCILVESDFFFSFNPEVILNALKNVRG